LDIRPQHALAVSGLEPIHSDPFDRLLVAQALTEPLTLITADLLVASYATNFIKVA
jgi:PIN domain nuclease of toxin-antitoxin system